MKTSDNGIKLIKQFEGCSLVAYKPVSTEIYYTIGYGHTGANITKDMKISQATADAYLKSDLVRFESAVNSLNLNLTQNQFDALVSFTYNCGRGSLLTLVKNRNLTQIADALLLYNRSGGKIYDGLTKRRKMEREMFLGGTFKSGKYKINATSLNVREGAGTNYKIVGSYSKGSIVTVYEQKNGFGRIGDNKYVSMSYLQKI